MVKAQVWASARARELARGSCHFLDRVPANWATVQGRFVSSALRTDSGSRAPAGSDPVVAIWGRMVWQWADGSV
ncbi:hypothetical protein GCM10009582_34730 [Arthrobacter flavus]